jgi:hypothetical protein
MIHLHISIKQNMIAIACPPKAWTNIKHKIVTKVFLLALIIVRNFKEVKRDECFSLNLDVISEKTPTISKQTNQRE